MKKSPLSLRVLALGTLLAAPLFSQTPAPAKPPAEVTLVRGENRELTVARAELEHMQQRYAENHPSILEQRQKIATLEKISPWLINLDFSGGSLSKFLNTMAKVQAVSFNIVGAGDPADFQNVELPPFSLHNASLGTIFEVLRPMLAVRGFDLTHAGETENSFVGVLHRIDAPKPEKRTAPTLFESFSLNHQLAEQSIDDIVATIREGWELDPAHDKNALRLKFHPATSILLVSGPPEAINVAAKVISQLKRPPANPVRVDAQGKPLPDANKE